VPACLRPWQRCERRARRRDLCHAPKDLAGIRARSTFPPAEVPSSIAWYFRGAAEHSGLRQMSESAQSGARWCNGAPLGPLPGQPGQQPCGHAQQQQLAAQVRGGGALLRGWLGLSARLPWHPRQRAHPQHLQPVPLRSAAALDGARSLRAASPPGSLCPLPGRGKSAAASCEAEQGSAPDTVPMHGQRGRPAALRRQALAGATLPGAGCLCMCGQGTRAGARAQVGAAGAPLAHLHMLQHIGLIDVRALPRQHACAGMRGGQHTRAHLSSGVLERGGARGGG